MSKQATRNIPQIDLKAQHRELRAELTAAFEEMLDSCQFVLGSAGEELEAKIAPVFGCSYGVGLNSGTDALVLALAALDVGPGDEVITTPFTFVATVEMILELGARPVLVDIEPDTLNIDPAAVEAAIRPATKVILPVHLYGQAADLTRLMPVARTRELPVVEDAAQAVGALHRGKPVGGFGVAGCVSFFPTKNLGACGDAGMLVTNDARLAERVRLLRGHGSRVKYQYEIRGRNSRLDNMQAAFLLAKLPRLETWNEARRAHAATYNEMLADLPLRIPVERPENRHVYHQYTIRVAQRDAVRERMREAGVSTAVHYPIPLHRQSAFLDLGYHVGSLPVSERVSTEVLSLPLYPELSREQIDRVVNVLGETLSDLGVTEAPAE